MLAELCLQLPTRPELDRQDKQHLSTAKGLYQVMVFAQAVDSVPALLTAACSQLDNLQITVSVQDKQIQMPVAGGLYDSGLGDPKRFYDLEAGQINWVCQSEQQAQDVKQQAQTSALLRIAHVLRLQPLIDKLNRFLCGTGGSDEGMLDGCWAWCLQMKCSMQR